MDHSIHEMTHNLVIWVHLIWSDVITGCPMPQLLDRRILSLGFPLVLPRESHCFVLFLIYHLKYVFVFWQDRGITGPPELLDTVGHKCPDRLDIFYGLFYHPVILFHHLSLLFALVQVQVQVRRLFSLYKRIMRICMRIYPHNNGAF